MLGNEKGAVGSAGAAIAGLLVLGFAVYIGWQYHKSAARSRADDLVQQAVNSMSNYAGDRRDRILESIAKIRSAKIRDDTSTIIEGANELELLLGDQHSSSGRPGNPTVVYNPPKFLLHVQAVATPIPGGQGYQWTTDMYFAGKWVTAEREPDADGQVDLVWLGALPVRCLTDRRYGPFLNSDQLCPKAQELGVKFARDTAQEVGCPVVIAMAR